MAVNSVAPSDAELGILPEKMPQSTQCAVEPGPRFVYISGDVHGPGPNDTTVDIITVPCPGADPFETWSREQSDEDTFGEYPHKPRPGSASRPESCWVAQEIRTVAPTARVLMYTHRKLEEGATLEDLAADLVDCVLSKCQKPGSSRPFFFIAHSIGGLVVKEALRQARRDDACAGFYNCHGVTFFATPHRGSSYLSVPDLRRSVRYLLGFRDPMPSSLANQIRIGNNDLLRLHEDFTAMAGEMRIWTFYETIESELSGPAAFANQEDISFAAPLVSIVSAIVGVRQETVYSTLDSDHTCCASFGEWNIRTKETYLRSLAKAVAEAKRLAGCSHHEMHLMDKVHVELIGFYGSPRTRETSLRLYFTKYILSGFLEKGLEAVLNERLQVTPAATPLDVDTGSGGSRLLQAAIHQPSAPHSTNWRVEKRQLARERKQHTAKQRDSHTSLARDAPPPSQRPQHAAAESAIDDRRDGEAAAVTRSFSDRISATNVSNYPVTEIRAVLDERAMHSSSTGVPGRKRGVLPDFFGGMRGNQMPNRRFMWLHTPFNNPVWVKNIFEKLRESHVHDVSRLFDSDNWISRHVQGRHSQIQPCFIKPACNYLAAETSGPAERPTEPKGILYLYLPYLHFETYTHLIKRRNIIKARLAHGRARPVPKHIAEMDSLELQVIWQYLSEEPPLNTRRTLDQFGYPSLRDTFARDDDQMLYKLTKNSEASQQRNKDKEYRKQRTLRVSISESDGSDGGSLKKTKSRFRKRVDHAMGRLGAEGPHAVDRAIEKDLQEGTLLMVDQLWLWAIDTTTLVTFFPKRDSHPSEGALFQQADLRNSIYNELNGDLTGQCDNALDLAAFAALHAVTVLIDRSSHPDLEVFRIFEEAIGMLTERMTTNLKRFRLTTFEGGSGHIYFDEDEDGYLTEDAEDNTNASIRERHRREVERAERENRDNTSALLELRDMEDELNTLSNLFRTQVTCLENMLETYQGDRFRDITKHGQEYLQEALNALAGYQEQVADMLKRVEGTRNDYEKLLSMAQRQATVVDMKWSRLNTELASSSNMAVVIFTTFTVIFLPLSFFTSLFGMNTADWAGPGNDNAFPTLGFIGAIGLPVSAFVIFATFTAAFSVRFQNLITALVGWTAAIMGVVTDIVTGLEPETWKLSKAKRKQELRKKRIEESKKKRLAQGFDFWAQMRRQRTTLTYEIPDQNRRTSLSEREKTHRRRATWGRMRDVVDDRPRRMY